MTNYERRKLMRDGKPVPPRGQKPRPPAIEAERSAVASAIRHSGLSNVQLAEVLTESNIEAADERFKAADMLKPTDGPRRCVMVGLVKVGQYYSALRAELDVLVDGSVKVVSISAREPAQKAIAMGQMTQQIHKDFVRGS